MVLKVGTNTMHVIDQDPFISALTLSQLGITSLPKRFVLPPSQRPNTNLHFSTTLPIVDFSALQDPSQRSQTVSTIQLACKQIGFFQVINHGIPTSVTKDAIDTATKFFNLPVKDKMYLVSDDIHEPVRYGTSINHTHDRIHFWRDFIKHYSHPISKWIHLWPSNPPCYREKMGNYAKAVQGLKNQLMEVVLATLGLNPDYLQEDVEEGSQVLAVNYYPACPEPDLVLGMPPHSDFSSLTILLQTSPGLQILDEDKNWVSVPAIEGALVVLLGDQLEVMSNGIYKSVIHRARVNVENTRISVASLHSLGFEKKVGPAPELVNKENPKAYGDFSFNDFLEFVSTNDIMKERYIDTLRKEKNAQEH